MEAELLLLKEKINLLEQRIYELEERDMTHTILVGWLLGRQARYTGGKEAVAEYLDRIEKNINPETPEHIHLLQLKRTSTDYGDALIRHLLQKEREY